MTLAPALHAGVPDTRSEDREVFKPMTPQANDADTRGGRTILIVDGHAYAYRAFYAIRKLSAPDGSATNAIYGFIRMLGKMKAQLNPTHWVVIWDGGLAAERMTAHPDYKAQRPPMPADLETQCDSILEWLDASRIPSLVRDGVEADDWIATVALRGADEGFKVVIASSDKDFMQLVGPRIGLLNPNDKVQHVWTDENVRAKAGVGPSQIAEWLSLVGDTVDNIPGVPGVGPRTAADLLNRFGSVEQLYARLEEVQSERLRTALAESRAIVRRNLDLVRLRDIDGEMNFGEFTVREPDVDRLQELYSRWGFRVLLSELQVDTRRQEMLL